MRNVLLLLLVNVPLLLWAQPFSVQGSVVDAVSKKPVEGAFVFINQSYKSTFTGAGGHYVLDNIQDKEFELVISMKGYVPLVYHFSPQKPASSITFELVKETDSSTLYDKDGWNKYAGVFMRNFLGTSTKVWCEILNPEALRFSYDSTKDELTVTSDGLLQISNERLGYLITYQLEVFKLSPSNNQLFINGYAAFKDLSSKRIEILERWKQARLEAFHGSAMHFFRSLYKNNLYANGFELHNVMQVFENEPGYTEAAKTKNAIVLKKGTSEKNGEVKKFIYLLDKKTFPADSVMYADKTNHKYAFNYKGILQVVYKKAKEQMEYALLSGTNTPGPQTSYLNFGNHVSLQPNGMYYNAEDLEISGYLNWEKLGKLLPLEYVEEQQ